MINEYHCHRMGNRKRNAKAFVKSKNTYKAGDVICTTAEEMDRPHLCIVKEDSIPGSNTEYVQICNFTGSDPDGKFSGRFITIGDFELPSKYYKCFYQKKGTNWIVCKQDDKTHRASIPQTPLGNLIEDCFPLWEKICSSFDQIDGDNPMGSTCDCNSPVVQENLAPCENGDCGRCGTAETNDTLAC